MYSRFWFYYYAAVFNRAGGLYPVPMLASVSFGAPMHVGDDEDKNAFLERARNAILELRQW